MNIRLLTATVEEIERFFVDQSNVTFGNHILAEGAAPPDIVLVSALERHRAGELWFWCAPRLFLFSAENLIIGSGCFKNSPREGTVEIGCGVAASHRGRNFATEGVELLTAEGFTRPEITAVTAETAVWNIASQKVLEKASFVRDGERNDPEDGPVITWRRERSGSR